MELNNPSVSIIMPALNSSLYLERVFDAIDGLNYPKEKLEVILVDNGSKDDTVGIARRRGAIVIEAPSVRIGQLRNIGAERACGEVFAFLDSDCIVDPLWLKASIPYLSKDHIGAVGGHTRIPDEATWIERTLDFHATKEGVHELEYLPTANLITKRHVFMAVGGFDLSLETGEDSDFCHRIRRLNLHLLSDTKIRVIHMDYPKTAFQLYKKEKWHCKELHNLWKSTDLFGEYAIAIFIPIVYLFTLISAIVLLGEGIFYSSFILLVYSIGVLFFIPMSLAVYKAISKSRVSFLVCSTLYFAIILLARINVLFMGFLAYITKRLQQRTVSIGAD